MSYILGIRFYDSFKAVVKVFLQFMIYYNKLYHANKSFLRNPSYDQTKTVNYGR